jgi:putative tricarboxylic transport membrane protein
MNAQHGDRITGALGILVSASYVAYARQIEDGLLADEVGAAGVPSAVGLLMMLASVALLLKASRRNTVQVSEVAQEDTSWSAHWLALYLLGVLAAYVLVLPVAGYWVSVALLIGAVSALVGARDVKVILACSVLGASGLYALFSLLLNIRMPAGLWPSWMGA